MHLALGTAFAAPALGGEPMEAKSVVEAPAERRGIPFAVEGSGQVEFLPEAASVPSGLVWHARLALPLYARLSESWKVTGSLGGELTDYELAPYKSHGLRVWKLSALLLSEVALSERWTAGGFVSLSFEEGADLGESLAGGALATLGYRWSSTLQTSLGPLYISRANDDPLIVPALGIEWQPTESFRFYLRGLQARAEYRLNESWDIFWRGEWDPSGVRLKERKQTRATGLSDNTVRMGPGITWHANEHWAVTVDGGVAFHRVELLDEDNEEVVTERLDPAAYLGLSISARF